MRLAFHAADRPDALSARNALVKRYGDSPLLEADCVVALGGDGCMLDALHAVMGHNIPVYGMNFGSVGFLMNDPVHDDLPAHLQAAEQAIIHPLRAKGTSVSGEAFESLAINEVSLLRQTRQTAKIRIFIDEIERMEELAADGVLVSTPAGSTAYNFSAHGPILPIDASLLALTPISAFRPRRWRGALLSHASTVKFEVIEPVRRPVAAVADNREFRDVSSVTIAEADDVTLTMLFDAGRALDERIILEQFTS
ncbi:inorganic polyphosphate/ATP-NAD kinase [Glycocaulis alkaliphilus]|uniref:NAD kinase n=1 Tax=Glycocaulis alkaliphilus TaxID=1434191 RepID=A0A3T0E981_9PROT|nr:NAD kinase [Glycocaulis alkaliphilus]AZU03756.1 inorganic polyphosphate/ATP-NAD kinase [Glycocaulis alkaliphilus]GGB83700.1 NAD kinase [Glycocaulis alkaliphilus]